MLVNPVGHVHSLSGNRPVKLYFFYLEIVHHLLLLPACLPAFSPSGRGERESASGSVHYLRLRRCVVPADNESRFGKGRFRVLCEN